MTNIELNINHVLNNNNNNNENFSVKKYTFNNAIYQIIKYNKEKLKQCEKEDYDYYKIMSKFRSVIIKNNKVVCYAPEKSCNYDFFKASNNSLECWVEDFIDGTMINVFYDNLNNCWEIATRSSVGGKILFFNDVKNYQYFNEFQNNENFKNLTFRSMFFEACQINNFDLNTLDKKYCYSFVLQHPLNRIVTPITNMLIYLVKVYEIIHPLNNCLDQENLNKVIINEINLNDLVNNPPYIFMNTNVKFVNRYPLNDFKIAEQYYNGEQTPFECNGCMIYNNQGIRTKIRNNNYEFVRKLRGNQPKLQFNYLALKQQNRVKEFLYYYPEHSVIFNKFKLIVFEYTNNLFKYYIDCFIKKEKPLREYPFQYKNHLFKLHEIFKANLKPEGKKVDKKVVIDYINQLHPAQLMFVINYQHNPDNQDNLDNLEDMSI